MTSDRPISSNLVSRMQAEIERLQAKLHRIAFASDVPRHWQDFAARGLQRENSADETKATQRVRLRLAKDIYDDGADHHPPGYIAHKGDLVVVHSIQTAVVSHRGIGHGFVVHDGDLELSSAEETSVSNPVAVEGDRTCAVGGAVLPGQPVFVDAARGSGLSQKTSTESDDDECYESH